MPENNKPILIYSTFPSKADAVSLGNLLVERALAACVNILPGMTSIYMWEGSLECGDEVVMLIKTVAGHKDAVFEAVQQLHAFANPALLVLPIEGGSPEFLDWIKSQTAASA